VKRNAAGLERTLKALKSRLPDEADALIAAARGLANAVDTEPANASLWREYRASIAALIEAGANDDPDDDTAAFFGSIRTPSVPAKMGDPSHN